MSDSAIGNFVIILLVKSGFFHKTDNIVISFADIKGGSCKRLVETDASYIIVEAKIYDTNGSGACAELEGNRNIFKPDASGIQFLQIMFCGSAYSMDKGQY